jgi:hypothetical protein
MIKPFDLCDGLYQGFERNMPTPMVLCSDYTATGKLREAADILFSFKQEFDEVFFSDFVSKCRSADAVKENLAARCSAIRLQYSECEHYDNSYSVEDFIRYSMRGALYYAYEGMLSQIFYMYEDLALKKSKQVALETMHPVVQRVYSYLAHPKSDLSAFYKNTFGIDVQNSLPL